MGIHRWSAVALLLGEAGWEDWYAVVRFLYVDFTCDGVEQNIGFWTRDSSVHLDVDLEGRFVRSTDIVLYWQLLT